jgi:hypothetical protein
MRTEEEIQEEIDLVADELYDLQKSIGAQGKGEAPKTMDEIMQEIASGKYRDLDNKLRELHKELTESRRRGKEAK